MEKQRILFIGAGRMAEAIFSGLLKKQKAYISEIIISNKSNEEKLQSLSEKYDVTVIRDWRNKVSEADVVLLAMPPSEHKQTLVELSSFLKGQLVITVAAGIGPSVLEQELLNSPVAWIMPNTSAEQSESMSLYTYGSNVNEDHKEVLQMIVAAIGQAQECTEDQIHKLTAITGSAPAFLYYFTESLIEKASELGVSEEIAKKLVTQMIYGSSVMLKSGREAKELREQVTTPGGATAAGLEVLMGHEFKNMVKRAVDATNEKALNQGKA